jgi:BirA family biotin operon repressor/biotin-[acetyl-CoA-carboxylase] ligase
MQIRRYAVLDSTNEEALRLAASGEKGPLWIVAGAQTSGRGRRGRGWVSARGNLFASLLLTGPLPLEKRAQLSFAAALAAADCAARFAQPVTLKWPNDVLLSGRKLGGILLESPDGESLIVGIGLNLASFPPDTNFPSISLAAQAGEAPSPEQAMDLLATRWDAWFGLWRNQGFSPLRQAWLARASGLGDKIGVKLGESEMRGIFEDLDHDGALLLRRADSSLVPIHAGEVYFRSAQDADPPPFTGEVSRSDGGGSHWAPPDTRSRR